MERRAYFNFQEKARGFSVGDSIIPVFADQVNVGRVIAVWPAIGMLDVEYPWGNKRYPVEDVYKANPEEQEIDPNGGAGTTTGGPTHSVSEGPSRSTSRTAFDHLGLVHRVINRATKIALYWAERGRKYRCTKSETANGAYRCPRCGYDHMIPTIYKREDSSSVRLMGCPECMFLIRASDIIVPGQEILAAGRFQFFWYPASQRGPRPGDRPQGFGSLRQAVDAATTWEADMIGSFKADDIDELMRKYEWYIVDTRTGRRVWEAGDGPL